MDGVLTKQQIDKFNTDGFLVIPDYCSAQEVKSLQLALDDVVDDLDMDKHPKTTFNTKGHVDRGDYFMKSGDKIRYFLEEDSLDEKGELLVDKRNAINKIGHGLHALNSTVKSFTFSKKIQNTVRSLSFVEPKIIQSMFILKPPKIGGVVTPHRDATFLYSDPLKLLGLWFPLVDVTLENACLWFIPGSQSEGISRRMMKNTDPNGPSIKFTGPIEPFDESKGVPVPVKTGAAVLIDGEVLHRSLKNNSSVGRPIFTFHLYESHNASWSSDNWLQPSTELPFPKLY